MTRAAGPDPWSLLACPCCLGTMAREPHHALTCRSCGRRCPAEEGMPSLIPPTRRSAFDASTSHDRRARLEAGWQPLGRAERLAHPEGAPGGYPPLYSPVRRQTHEALLALLDHTGVEPAASPAADIGAGIRWLAYRLAQRGHPILALDGSLDADFGLGASGPYVSACRPRLLPVCADLDLLPLRPGALALVLFNVSLHHATDVGQTLGRVAAALAPGGHLLILDTPIYRQPPYGAAEGEQRLGRGELIAELNAAGLEPRVVSICRSLRWSAYQGSHVLRGRSPFSFPVLIGSKPGRSRGAS